MPAMKPAAPGKKFGTITLTPKKKMEPLAPGERRKSC